MKGLLVRPGGRTDHWSFLFGQIAIHSLIVLIVTGIFLTFFYDPDATRVIYDGVYRPIRGVPVSRAWEPVVSGHPLTLSILIPALIVPGAFFTVLAAYPLIERRLTGDRTLHHALDRPREAAVRNLLGTSVRLAWQVALPQPGGAVCCQASCPISVR
ncbi:hypothetical protein [Nonomuraea sp. NPDC050643]|uniref:hypothetical protein n=1 Tax=Nonomuraea sp. NPDC050643 TaxID=3155660 RepID=UPI0033CA543A